MQPVYNNRLLRRLQRHQSMSVIFRSVEPSLPPVTAQKSGDEASPLAGLPVVQARLMPVQDANLPVAPPATVAAPPARAGTSPVMSAPSPVATAIPAPTLVPPAPYPAPAQPAQLRAPVQTAPFHQTPASTPAAVVSEAPAAEVDDRTWKRLQAIIRKHEEQDQELMQQQAPISPVEESPASIGNQPEPPIPARAAAPAQRSVVELPQVPRREAEVERAVTPVSQSQPVEPDIPALTLPPAEPKMPIPPMGSLTPEASTSDRQPPVPPVLEGPAATRADAVMELSMPVAEPGATTAVEIPPVQTSEETLREEDGQTERIPRAEIPATTAAGRQVMPVEANKPVPAQLDKILPAAPESVPVPVQPAGEKPLPLQAVWPVERLESQTPTPAFSSPKLSTLSAAAAPEVSPELEKIITAIKPGQPTDSHVEVITPRQPRPVIPPAAKPAAVQKKPVSETESPAPAVEHKIDTISTEVGNLPADLWTLIGEKPPVSSVKASEMPAPKREAPVSVDAVSAPAPEAQRLPQAAQQRPAPLPVIQPRAPVVVQDAAPAQTPAPSVVQTSPAEAAAAGESAAQGAGPAGAGDVNVDELARRVYTEIKRRLVVEWERIRQRF